MYWCAKLKIFGRQPHKIDPIRPYFADGTEGQLNNAVHL